MLKQSITDNEKLIGNKMRVMEERTQANHSELLDKIGQIMQPINEKIDDIGHKQDKIGQRQDRIEFRHEELEHNITTINGKLGNLKDEILEELKAEQTNKTDPGSLAAFHYTLANEIEQESCKLLIFGYKNNTNENACSQAKKMIENICTKSNITVDIRNIAEIGKSTTKDNATILVTLGNQYQRNDLLRNGKLIPEGISVDKCTPLLYREAYKKMKKKARSCNKFFGTQTQIVFTGHLMQLRYREEGKAYTLIEEYSPSPTDAGKIQKGNKTEGETTTPSASINAESIKQAKRFVVLNGLYKSTEGEIKEWLQKLFTEQDYKDITELKKVGKSWLLGFKDEAKTKYISTNYREKKHDGHTFKPNIYES